jgi:hypothetical protein
MICRVMNLKRDLNSDKNCPCEKDLQDGVVDSRARHAPVEPRVACVQGEVSYQGENLGTAQACECACQIDLTGQAEVGPQVWLHQPSK